MCLDLVAKHFTLTSTNTKIHSDSPLRFTDGDNHSWLFLDKQQAIDGDALQQLLEELISTPKWSTNTYTKALISHPAIMTCLQNDTATFDMLYTMSIDLSKLVGIPSMQLPGWRVEDGRDWFRQTYPDKANLVNHESVLLIRDDADNVGGFLLALEDTQAGLSRVYISDLFVFEEYRRKGLASALIRSLIKGYHTQKSACIVCLTVFCENPGAVAAYFKLGLKVDDVIWVIGSK